MFSAPPINPSYFDNVKESIYPLKNSQWANLKVIWQEKVDLASESSLPVKGQKTLQHIYTPVLDLASEKGDLYLDCSNKKIYSKICVNLLYRIFTIVAKTLYALILPLSLTITVCKTLQQYKKLIDEQTLGGHQVKLDQRKVARKCLNNCLRTIQSIVRTPMYEIALLGLSLAAMGVGIFCPGKLLDFRKIIGKVIKRNERHTKKYHVSPINDHFMCFSPVYSLKKAKDWKHKSKRDTRYLSKNNLNRGLINFCRSQILYRREHATFGSAKLLSGQVYISPRYLDFQSEDSPTKTS